MVDEFLYQRQEAIANNAPIPEFKAAAGVLARYSGVVYSVRAMAVMPDGAMFLRDAVVEIQHGGSPRVVFHSWKEGDAPASRTHEI